MAPALRGEEEGLLLSRFRKRQGGFAHLPAAELLLLMLVQRRSSQEKTTPRLALSGHPVLRVREAWPGFSSGLLPVRKGVAVPGLARCAASSSPPHRRPGTPERAARSRRAEATTTATAKTRRQQSQGGAPRREALHPQFPDTTRCGRQVNRVDESRSKTLDITGL